MCVMFKYCRALCSYYETLSYYTKPKNDSNSKELCKFRPWKRNMTAELFNVSSLNAIISQYPDY